MIGYLIVLVLALIWFAVSGGLGPTLLSKLSSDTHPRYRLFYWMGGLYSLAVSALTILFASAILVYDQWAGLEHTTPGAGNLMYVILISVLPWVGVASLGVIAALIFTRLEPAGKVVAETNRLLLHASTPVEHFHGVAVRVLEVPFLAAALIDYQHQPTIFVSRGCLNDLTSEEIAAVFWHEHGHAVGEHNGIKRIAKVASVLLPWLPLCRLLPLQVHQACEDWADLHALKAVAPGSLASARVKFEF